MSKLPYPEHFVRGYPPGTIPDRRRIIKCSNPKAWYSGMVGQVITVHFFVTMGAWDTQGRWLWYYDLSAPIKDEPKPEKKKSFFSKLFSKKK
jgi:hypothetical protein